MEISQQLRKRLIEPSSKITGQDRRRQASLLSSFLLGTIVLGALMEAVTIAAIDREGYTGYRLTIAALSLFAIVYGISRTEQVRLAAALAVILASVAIFFTGWAEPTGVLGGLFDLLILPLWLGSLYLSIRSVIVLVLLDTLTLLAFPLFTTTVTFSDILIGPFSFLVTTSILLMVITWHRNQLEQDRRAELTEKERRSHREAARAKALLRVAEHLNAQLGLDTLLTTICEEVSLALDTPISMVSLYDQKQNAFRPTAAVGIPAEILGSLLPFPRPIYDEAARIMGTTFGVPDLQSLSQLPNFSYFQQQGLHALAFATMQYEGELIGSLVSITQRKDRQFTEDELLLLQGLARQAALAIINTKLFKDAHRRLEHLQALRVIDMAINSNHNLSETLQVLLQQMISQLRVDAAVILPVNESEHYLEYCTSTGFRTQSLRYTRLRMGEGIAGRAAQKKETIFIRDLRTDPQTLVYAPALDQEGFISYFAVPLIAQGRVRGVLELFNRSALDPDAEWFYFLEALAGQAAIAIESTVLFEGLQRTNAELSNAYDSTIEGWSHALDLRDKETEGHTQRVNELTLELARVFGFSEAERVHIRRGALLHDIGKMGVPDSILLKEGKLTSEEWEVMRKHPDFAHEMLLPITYLRPALDIPYCHHEKWDGSGYPRGLKGEEIPLTARIFAVVDVWDALTSDRPYRAAWSREKALKYICKGAGSHFDPRVVEAFVELLKR
jgi:putative nucleotidyltransferase with HDIG domain